MGKLPNIKADPAAGGTLHFGATLLILLCLAGCTGMQPGYETPSVTVKSFRALPATGALPNFEIGLEVVNPNEEELKLAGIAYTISIEGHEIIKGVGNDLPVIEGYGTGTVMVTASASLFAGIGLFTDLMQSPKETFEYGFEAKLDPGGFRPSIRVKDSGTISAGNLQQ
jgi:LEA14-like dessication related protein